MARHTGPKCRFCRREGMKLFLKGTRCDTAKCAVTRRDYPPGMHSWRRSKFSEYGIQLREKQKVKRAYGIFERQFRNYFSKAERSKGNTGENLLTALERRLDNVVFLAGLATSRSGARQLIGHGHVTVNDRRVDVPSFSVKQQDVIKVSPQERIRKLVASNIEQSHGRERPSWIDVDLVKQEVRIVNLPTREEVSVLVREQLIIEFCSK